MRFGEGLAEDRLEALLTPGGGIDTVITADTYGQGEADRLLGRALSGTPRDSYSLVGAVGHDFYEGERDGPKGFPRFTDPRLRGPDAYGDYLRMATERSLDRLGADHLDLLLLHNPDRTGYSSELVWTAMARLREEGLAAAIGVAPGPANGFTLDLLDCFERFGELLDWAMVILNPFEPWPGELILEAASERRIELITRVVDYGGLFWGDVRPRPRLRRARPPQVPPRRLGRAGSGQARGPRADPRSHRPDPDPARLLLEPRPARRRLRCPDPDPGDRARGPADRGEAGRARRPAGDKPADRCRPDRDPRDRRQLGLHGAEGSEPRARGRAATRRLAAERGAHPGRTSLGNRAGARSRPAPRGVIVAGVRREPGAAERLGARLLTGPAGRATAFAIDFCAALIRAARGHPEHPEERRAPGR